MTDIFNDEQKQAQTPPADVVPPQAPAIPETLKEWVGEGKKYASIDAAMAALGPAQTHISKLEQELAELRAAQASQNSVEDVRKAVEDLLAERGHKPAELDEAKVASLVTGLWTSHEQQRSEKQNVDGFKATLAKAYGDKAKEKFGAVASQHGMTPEQLSDMVRKTPSVALALFQDIKSPHGAPALKGDLNTGAFGEQKPTIPEKKDVMRGAPTSTLLEQWRRAGVLAQQDNKE